MSKRNEAIQQDWASPGGIEILPPIVKMVVVESAFWEELDMENPSTTRDPAGWVSNGRQRF